MSTINRKGVEYKLVPIDGNTDYYVSECGKLWNERIGKRLKDGVCKRKGYIRNALHLEHGIKTIWRHRLVAITVIDNPNNYDQVDHIDRNKLNNHIANLRWVDTKTNTRNRSISKRNNTGVNGVQLKVNIKSNREVYFYTACWVELDGTHKKKSFSFTNYGKEEAFRLACEYRYNKIKELNEQGAGYTNQHGL